MLVKWQFNVSSVYYKINLSTSYILKRLWDKMINNEICSIILINCDNNLEI